MEADQALWLAKFPAPSDTWNQPRVEHGLLLLARRCGLQVAESRLTRVGDADVLLVKRFDRDWSEGGYRRHRMVSALTLLQAEDSATDRGRWSSVCPTTRIPTLCATWSMSRLRLHIRKSPGPGTTAELRQQMIGLAPFSSHMRSLPFYPFILAAACFHHPPKKRW